MTIDTAPITPLSPVLRKVAQHLVHGFSNRQIAVEEHLSPSTATSYVKTVREHIACPPRCSRAVLVHTILTHRQATVPPVPTVCKGFQADKADRRLIRAITRHSKKTDMAQALGLSVYQLAGRLAGLQRRMAAQDDVDIVILAHGLRLLGNNTADSPPSRQAPPGPAGTAAR